MWSTSTIIDLAERFCRLTGKSEARLATIVFNDGQKFARLRNGADCGLATYRRAMDWFAENWPDDSEVPDTLSEWKVLRATQPEAAE